jgi:hypothetical protein
MVTLLDIAAYNWINRSKQEINRKHKRFTKQAMSQAIFFKIWLYRCYGIKIKNLVYDD